MVPVFHQMVPVVSQMVPGYTSTHYSWNFFLSLYLALYLYSMHSMEEESNLRQKVYEESPTSYGCAKKVFVAAVFISSAHYL